MFTQNEVNLPHRRWLELLKNHVMSILYHPGKGNLVADAISRMTMASVSDVHESKRDLAKDVHGLARLGVRLEDSAKGGYMVDYKSKLFLIVEVKSKKHLERPLMELQQSVLSKLKESFSLREPYLRKLMGHVSPLILVQIRYIMT